MKIKFLLLIGVIFTIQTTAIYCSQPSEDDIVELIIGPVASPWEDIQPTGSISRILRDQDLNKLKVYIDSIEGLDPQKGFVAKAIIKYHMSEANVDAIIASINGIDANEHLSFAEAANLYINDKTDRAHINRILSLLVSLKDDGREIAASVLRDYNESPISGDVARAILRNIKHTGLAGRFITAKMITYSLGPQSKPADINNYAFRGDMIVGSLGYGTIIGFIWFICMLGA